MPKIELWKNRDKRVVDPRLFSSLAENFAKDLARDNRQNSKMNKRTQLRKFYDEVLRLDMEARGQKDEKEDQWHRILPLVHMLTAKAAYAKGRKLVSDTFLNFIKESVEQIKDPEDLSVFASFFEAVMGFYRYYGCLLYTSPSPRD